METQTKFQTLFKEELCKLSTEELNVYTLKLKTDIKRLKSETDVFKKQVEEDRLKTAELRGEIKVWKELNQLELKKIGWEDLTEEEITWLMKDDNYHKEWPIFKPGVRAIKKRYAEKMQKSIDDTLNKKFA